MNKAPQAKPLTAPLLSYIGIIKYAKCFVNRFLLHPTSKKPKKALFVNEL